ncbi:MAG TPA: hypothetical protein VGG62_12225 [Terracidiphilus sp.]|jgi:hypothetical protein
MARLIDDIRGGRLQMPWFVAKHLAAAWEEQTLRICEFLRDEIPVILIDNVADYYYGAEQEYWSLDRDFPNCAPPFPRFWSEHRMPRVIHSKEKGDTKITDLITKGRIGVLVTGTRIEDVKTDSEPPPGTKWILWCELFLDFGVNGVSAQGPNGSIFMTIDENGAVLGEPWMQSFDGGAYADIIASYMTWLHPTLLAITFLHCRNVTVVDNPVPPKLARRYRERHAGRAPVAHKTLIIEPLKAVLRKEGRSGEVGIQKAMHICRGHFKDYREGRGLFGKYHQLVWQPMLVRGGSKGDTAAPREVKIKV